MDPLQLKQQLVAEAISLGFDACRIASAQPPPHGSFFLHWLSEGKAGEMLWLSKNSERRTNPELVLPGVRSILMLAKNYCPPAHQIPTTENSQSYQIARYALGEDYHEVLTPRVRQLEQILAANGGVQRSYVDTGPVMERDFAALAGIGWHGKSTMLISKKLGAFFFLGALLTTLELPIDEPAKNHCGKCSQCIDVCPTGAITAPYQLDARRCIAYLTIELKGSIPEELRPLIGDRIYGCDDCAAVCPWNRFAQVATEPRFEKKSSLESWKLRDFLSLDDSAFRNLFRDSPIKRIKRRGFLRNVCVALGNVGTLDDIPALETACLDPEPLIAEHAQWASQRLSQRLATSPTSISKPL